MEDHIGKAPDIVTIKFDIVESARKYIEDNKNAKHFEGLWCNMSQSPEEREHFEKNVQPLFKIKRAILEVTSIDAAKVVVSKAATKVFVTEGENLKLIAEMKTKNNIVWDEQVSDEIKTRYATLME